MSMNSTIQCVFGFLFPGRNTQRVRQTVDEIAGKCQAGLWQRICRQATTMSVAEIRGYARAHAAGFAEDEVDQALCRHGLNSVLRRRVIDATVNQLIGMVIHDAFCATPPSNSQMMAA